KPLKHTYPALRSPSAPVEIKIHRVYLPDKIYRKSLGRATSEAAHRRGIAPTPLGPVVRHCPAAADGLAGRAPGRQYLYGLFGSALARGACRGEGAARGWRAWARTAGIR